MTLDQLKYFAAAATYQHIGRAAVAVSISPSVISSAIGTLEDELSCELFRKRGRRIELTAEGQKLLERSKSILQSVDKLKADIKGGPESLIGRYRIGASHFLASRLLLAGWSDLHKKNPGLVADIFSMNTAHAIADVLSGRLDLAVCFSPLTHPDLKEFKLFEGQLVAVVRKKHPILRKSSKEQIKFISETKAIIHKATNSVESCESHPAFDQLGFQPKIEVYFDSDDIAAQAVINSDRWSFVPDIVANEFKDSLEVIPFPSSVVKRNYHVSALIRRDRDNESIFPQLVESLCPRTNN
jgi:DNA-binding transcriptional LysR family regulator